MTRPGCTTSVQNQSDELTPAEKKEMHDFGRAATVLSIFKSKARRTLGVELKTRGSSRLAVDAALTRLVWQRAYGRFEYCRMPQAADDAPFRSTTSSPQASGTGHSQQPVLKLLLLQFIQGFRHFEPGPAIAETHPALQSPPPQMGDAFPLAGSLPDWPHADRSRDRRSVAHQ